VLMLKIVKLDAITPATAIRIIFPEIFSFMFTTFSNSSIRLLNKIVTYYILVSNQ